MYCNQCGAKNDAKAKFCGGCGAPLGGAPATANGTPPQMESRSNAGWVVAAVLAVALAAALIYALGPRKAQSQDVAKAPVEASVSVGATGAGTEAEGTAATESTEPAAHEAEPEPAAHETKPQPPPEPSEDPVAKASVVLENYLAADLGHDGNEMAKYLGGNAAARFRPEVQGQEDVTVHSKVVSGHTVKGPNEIDFKVAVKWSPSDSDETKTDTEKYILKRTDKGWKIVSTPAYP